MGAALPEPLRARAWPTVLLVLFCLGAGIPTAVALTPSQELVVFGQSIAVGARSPSLTLSGPAQVEQIGNTRLDVDRLQVYGPLRPKVTLGPVQRGAVSEVAQVAMDPDTGPRVARDAVDTVTGGFVTWYLWGGLLFLGFTLAAAGAATGLRTLLVLRRQTRAERTGGTHLPLAEIWRYCARGAGRMTAVALAAAIVAWLGAGALAVAGSAGGLRNVGSLSQLVGARHFSPEPVGPEVSGFDGVVIGDSRAARLGGPVVAEPSPDEAACGRSSDSLAAQIGSLTGRDVLNLACPDATITSGLRGPQLWNGAQLPAQIGLVRQMQDLDFVVVAIGPNDIGWIDFLLYCYGVPDCSDNLTSGEFDYRLAAFDRVFSDLLVDLNELPGRPQVVVMTSYGAFAPDADCPDTRGPEGVPGLDATKIELLTRRNDQLNEVLDAGAQAYGFAVARPYLGLLCEDSAGGLGQDLQGLTDPFPYHPTGVGSLRMAASVAPLLAPPPTG